MSFPPTRDAALARLTAFAPHAGRDYAALRNYDRPGHGAVSQLSPYLRHRIITEDEVLHRVLQHHSPQAAEKFIQEVYWRTYWKGWLEQRPTVWTQYKAGLTQALNRVQTESGLRQSWEAACTGTTGIACFDHWARELADTAYLHNHARMWFASIWIFTLRLPWELGADFFLRHLADGDPASNTLGWRWVAGLQTIGKTYLARADNIAKYTDNRFAPKDLAPFAAPLEGPPHPDRETVPTSDPIPQGQPDTRIGHLITDEDMSPAWIEEMVTPAARATFNGTPDRSPLAVSDTVTTFTTQALSEATKNDTATPTASPQDIDAWAARENLSAIVLSYPPQGPTADALRQVKTPLIRRVRPYDEAAWPHAKAGFFKFKTQIPKLLRRYDAQLSLI